MVELILGFPDKGKEVFTKGNDAVVSEIKRQYGLSDTQKISLELKERILLATSGGDNFK